MWRLIGAMLALLLVASTGLLVRSAGAQVPPHTPGTICFTPSFWCWANPPGRPGGSCSCPSAYGFVPGWLG